MGNKEDRLILFAIFVHLFDFFVLKFDMGDAVSWVFRIFFYFLLAIYASSVLSKERGDVRTYEETFGISFVSAIILPVSLSILRYFNVGEAILTPYQWALFAIPLWLFYLLGYKGIQPNNRFLHILINFYLLALVVLFLVFITSNMIESGRVGDLTFEGSSIEPLTVLSSFFSDFVWDPITNMYSSALGLGSPYNTNITKENIVNQENWDKIITSTSNNNFKSSVAAADYEIGIFLDRINIRDRYTENNTVRIANNIRIRTFEDENVEIEFSCIAKGYRNEVYEGNIVSPKTRLYEGLDSDTIFCEFEDLPTASYDYTFEAKTAFKTRGYADFYFVNEETVLGLFDGDENIDARSYGIPRSPRIEDTQGPVKLSMNDSQAMPIAVFFDRRTNLYLDWQIENRNTRLGKIQGLNEFSFHLPKDFTVLGDSCTLPVNSPQTSPEDPAYNMYNLDIDSDDVQLVGCQVFIDQNQADSFVSNQVRDLNEVTIFTEIGYDYILSEYDEFMVVSR